MRHRVMGRKLGRSSAHRVATLRNLSAALFTHERITTTLGKAKEMRPFAERLITLSKQDTLHARRLAARHIRDKQALKRLFETIGPRFAERPGGYTRLYHLGHRPGDAADMALVELVDAEAAAPEKKAGASEKKVDVAPEAGPGEGEAAPESGDRDAKS